MEKVKNVRMDDPEVLNRRARLRELISECFNNNGADLIRHIAAHMSHDQKLKKHSPSELSRILKDHGGQPFGTAKARRLAEQIGLNRHWFDMPIGTHVNKDEWMLDLPVSRYAPDTVKLAYSNPASLLKPVTDEITIRQWNTGGSMGAGVVLRDQPGVIRNWTVTLEWLAKNIKNCTSHNNLNIVTGFGDSMRPMFNPGDPLVIDTGIKTVDFDAIYFFRVGQEGFLKRLQRIPGEGIRAISENKSYESWTITPEMDFEVFGRVIKVWCSEEF